MLILPVNKKAKETAGFLTYISILKQKMETFYEIIPIAKLTCDHLNFKWLENFCQRK